MSLQSIAWCMLASAICFFLAVQLLTRKNPMKLGALVIDTSSVIPNARGVFATRSFDIGDVVERAPVIEDDENVSLGVLDEYSFDLENGKIGTVLGYGAMYNHSFDPNLIWSYDGIKKEMTFTAVKRIRQGDELFHSYGQKWWEDRGMKPV